MDRGRTKTVSWVAVLLLAAAVGARGAQDASMETLDGKLAFKAGTGPVLESKGKTVTLSARTTYLFRSLADERLRNKDVRLIGTQLPDGTFKVEEIRTVHEGRVYKVRYFCETCNIEALEPGPCVCCQQPVELQEVPLDKNDKRIIVTR